MAFVHLHTHSSYSPMWGVPTVEALCQAAETQGQDYLALTDTNGLYGAIRFLEVAREHGLKPIIGAELVSGCIGPCCWQRIPSGTPISAEFFRRGTAMHPLTSSRPWRGIEPDW